MTSLVAHIKRSAITHDLRQCQVFADLPQADLAEIAAITVRKALTKGEYLFWEGTPVHGFYIVLKGAIKVYRANLMGKEQVLHVFRDTECFAEEALVSQLGYPADACATEDSVVLLVQKPGFVSLLKRQPELALCLLRSINKQVVHLISLLDDLTLKDVKTRLAQWLIRHCPDPSSHAPQHIELPATKRMLAAELGISSETFSRTLAKFRAQKLLAVNGKILTLLCPPKMAQILQGSSVVTASTARLWREPLGNSRLTSTPATLYPGKGTLLKNDSRQHRRSKLVQDMAA